MTKYSVKTKTEGLQDGKTLFSIVIATDATGSRIWTWPTLPF